MESVSTGSLLEDRITKEKTKRGFEEGIEIIREGPGDSEEKIKIYPPYFESFPSEGEYRIHRRDISPLIDISRKRLNSIIYRSYIELPYDSSDERYCKIDKRWLEKIKEVIKSKVFPPLKIRGENSGEVTEVNYPYNENFPKERRYYMRDKDIGRFLDFSRISAELLMERVGINITRGGERLLSFEELNKMKESKKDVFKEREIAVNAVKLDREIEKTTLGEAIEKIGDCKPSNIEIYRRFRDLCKLYELEFPENLSYELIINKDFAESLNKVMWKRRSLMNGPIFDVPFETIRKIESLKEEYIEEIAAKTGQECLVVEEVIKKLGYIPSFRKKAGGRVKLNGYDIYKLEKQFYPLIKNKGMYLGALGDLIFFASNSPSPGVIGHIGHEEYNKAIERLKGGEKRIEKDGAGSINFEGIGNVPYSEIKVEIISEATTQKIIDDKKEKYTPSCYRNFRLEELVKLC